MNETTDGKALVKAGRKTWKLKYQIRHGKGKTPAGNRIGKTGGKGARAKRDARRAPIRSYYRSIEIYEKALAGAINVGEAIQIDNATASLDKAVTDLAAARRAYAKGREDRVALAQKGLRVITT